MLHHQKIKPLCR